VHPNVKPDYSKLSGPVLGLFAEKDAFVTPETARQVDADIKKAGKQSEIHIYPNVDHAFFNDENKGAYNKQAADDAWRRTLAFFRTNLKNASVRRQASSAACLLYAPLFSSLKNAWSTFG